MDEKKKEKLVRVIREIKESASTQKEDILLAVLHETQKIFDNFIPLEAAQTISDELGVGLSRVYELETFYSMYSTVPRGRHVIRYCESLPCHVRGGRQVKEALEEVLGVKTGETTKDGMFTLESSSCLGLCGVGPVIMIDEEAYGNMTPQKVKELIEKYYEEYRGEVS